eukprot:TRINITY_DN11244_c0_g1_i1.p1 TRINITY_DN11244_c0_g1~~TRINITY_DN11244_c0_g1_i1.p1  ORF type:complete len:120 (-),score=12.16 TRINITY_DN11244_c0_g1_i1:236-595(-)
MLCLISRHPLATSKNFRSVTSKTLTKSHTLKNQTRKHILRDQERSRLVQQNIRRVTGQSTTERISNPTKLEHFSKLNLMDPVLRSLSQCGYTEPTEVQKKTIPLVIKGLNVPFSFNLAR